MTTLEPLHDIDALDAALEESRDRPVLLFKHSLTCGVSAHALDELQTHLDQADTSVAYKLVTVQSHRRVSDELAARLDLRHETPQAILVHDGRVVWSASHFRVTAEAIVAAIQSISISLI